MSDADVNGAVAGSCKPETFLAHFRDIREAKGEHSDIGMSVARAKKAAKRDGVDLNVLSVVERLKDMDEGEQDAFISKLRTYSGWLKMPLGAYTAGITIPEVRASSQSDFENWQAGEAGKNAGAGGQPREANPYHAGSPLHVAWDKRWAVGFRLHNKRIAGEMAPAKAGRMRGDAANGAGAPAH